MALNPREAPNQGWGDDPFPLILEERNDPKVDAQEKAFLKLVEGMSEVAKENGAQFLILEIPINFQVNAFFTKIVLGKEWPIKRDYFKEINPELDRARH